MLVIRDINELPAELRGGAVSIGNFDGVHRGHAQIVSRLRTMAARVGGPAVVFTFDPHPIRLLRPEAAPTPLCTPADKLCLLERLGADAVIVYPTDKALLGMAADEFFEHFICEKLAARGLVEGQNFYFGRDRGGDVQRLRGLCDGRRIELEVVDSVALDGHTVSSSQVRQRLAAGDVQTARGMLGRPYRVSGLVVHGAGRGRTLGFPTANVEGVPTLLPGLGIYAGRAVDGGRRWPAAISLGPNPTFGEGGLKFEVYLIGFDGDLYDRPLEVDFLSRLRDIRRFDGVEQLLTAMNHDVATAAAIAAEHAD